MTKQLRMSRINLEIKNNEKALAITDKVLEVLKTFDGKVMSKRIDTKLKEIDSNLNFRKNQYDDWCLYYGFWDSRYDTESKCYVFNDEFYYLNYFKPDSSVLNYAEIEEKIKKAVEYKRESISKLKQQLKQIDKILEKRKKLCEQINEIHNSIHYIIRNDLDLDTHTFYYL